MKKKTLILFLLVSTFVPTLSYALEDTSTSSKTVTTGGGGTSTNQQEEQGENTPQSFTLCSQEAIETRDSSIASSRSIYNTAMANVLVERKNKEKTAVAIKEENKKKNAIKLSAENYKHQAKIAQTLVTQARKDAWETFEENLKTCREEERLHLELGAQTSSSTNDKIDTIDTKEKKIDSIESKGEEVKSLRDTLKTKLENLKSLFN